MEQRESIVESRSFDHVPEQERHGTVRTQVQFWFMVNATLITLFTGAVGPAMGLGLTWTLLAVVVGSVFGTLFQAFHGAQGPHMGLPQMIQSRVQFGSRGAVLPLAAVTIVQLGFAIFLIQTASSSLAAITVDQTTTFDVVIGAAAVVLAVVGYRLLLRVEKVASFVTLANLALLTVAALVVLPIGSLLGNSAFVPVAFLAQFGAAAMYQIAIAPMVSDYTRYLPFKTSGRAVSAAVFGGTLLSAVWLEALGAALALASPQGADLIAAIRDMGDKFGFGLGTASMAVAVVSCLITCSLSFYSGSVSLLSAFEAFRPLKSSGAVRAITLAGAGVVVIAATLFLPADFLPAFNAFLSILGYFLIPWTAVNLTDYYVVRRGVYSISDIMRSDGGIYGRWGVPGMISYALGFLAMIPFFSTSIYTGPVAAALGGADISFAVGLAVASGSYLLFMRRRDFTEEFDAVRAAPLNTLDEPPLPASAPTQPMEGNLSA
ncbi:MULTISPECIES: cytosine permease [Arthrobacter]|uniref:Cytosine permease n=1 Tax=Arthrobacter terricola TaxID=2547396 RepID=A0A4R5K8K3_9MICC|nr:MULTISPECIES: cytosine permease [Arthrobacter]MBT8163161.1 cytosine permease [Arthrobacter sp. GN70]TDF91269.1 cytosine permease [Arthrobacter terricola]